MLKNTSRFYLHIEVFQMLSNFVIDILNSLDHLASISMLQASELNTDPNTRILIYR
jgi:hypothetical protein